MDSLPYFVFLLFLAVAATRSVPKEGHQDIPGRDQKLMHKLHRHLKAWKDREDLQRNDTDQSVSLGTSRRKDRRRADLHQVSNPSRTNSRKLLEVDEVAESGLEKLLRSIRSEVNKTQPEKLNNLDAMDTDLRTEWGNKPRVSSNPPADNKDTGEGEDGLIGSASDYVLIAMIVAMMFCMTLCCLCLFCRSSSRLSICGINFELNDRRNSLNAGEDLSEIHEVVPLTPTTAGEYNNRLPDIESMLRADAPPPLYNEIVKEKMERKTAVSLHDELKRDQAEQQAKEVEAKASLKNTKKKPRLYTQTSNTSESSAGNGGRNSWKMRGILASFRAKSSMLRQRRSDSALQRHNNVEEGLVPIHGNQSDGATPSCVPEPIPEEGGANKQESVDATETVGEHVAETCDDEAKRNKVFVYDVNELHEADDDVFM